MCYIRDQSLDPFCWILLITEDENLDSVLFSTAFLRREQSLKGVFLVIWTILGSSLEPKNGVENKNRCVLFGTFFRILFSDPFDHSRRKS